MTNKEILQADMLDILFEHRNKNYGAYTLRREYNHHMKIALAIALSIALLSVLYSFLNNNNTTGNSSAGFNDSVIVRTVIIPPNKIEKTETKIEKVKTVKSVSNIKIVPNNEVTDMPEVKEIEKAVVGNETINGKELDDPNKIVKTGEENDGDKLPAKTEPEEGFVTSSSPASFPGGLESWLGFLRKYLQSPDDLETGQKIEVRVKFWIDTDGSLSRFEIVKSGGSSFDKEVLRVMKKMPKWEPATQNKNKVAVSYTQPVIFMGVEE
jgi:protein TonB